MFARRMLLDGLYLFLFVIRCLPRLLQKYLLLKWKVLKNQDSKTDFSHNIFVLMILLERMSIRNVSFFNKFISSFVNFEKLNLR